MRQGNKYMDPSAHKASVYHWDQLSKLVSTRKEVVQIIVISCLCKGLLTASLSLLN